MPVRRASDPPRRLPRAEREQQTLDIATELFARRGYAELTMDEVAAAVGVTKPLLYHYFGNKEGLYLACIGRSADALLARVTRAFAEAGDPGQGLREGLRAFFAFVDDNRLPWQLLYDETVPAGGRIAEHIRAYREQLTSLIGEALHGLDPAPPPALRPGLVHALTGAVESLTRWWLQEGADSLSAADTADAFIALVRPGFARLGGGAASTPTTTTGAPS